MKEEMITLRAGDLLDASRWEGARLVSTEAGDPVRVNGVWPAIIGAREVSNMIGRSMVYLRAADRPGAGFPLFLDEEVVISVDR